MTPQEIFDKVCTHLMTQRVAAKESPTGACMYRGEDGTMCAVGCLVPDELYDADMEYRQVDSLLSAYCLSFPAWMVDNEELLMKLQHAHDEGFKSGVVTVANMLKSVGEDFHLTVPDIVLKELV